MKVTIVGAGTAGLFASLMLARAGHEVVVLERVRIQPAPDVESAAAAAFRPSAPQIVQPHIVMARCRELLLQWLPDVYGALIAAGVTEAPVWTQMPDSLSDHSTWPGDEQLTMLMTRRSTLDWVLQRAVLAEPGVTLRCGVHVTGLLTAPGEPPHVTGVRTDHGDLAADLVLDAAGRSADWPTSAATTGCARRPRYPPFPRRGSSAGLDEFTIEVAGTGSSPTRRASYRRRGRRDAAPVRGPA